MQKKKDYTLYEWRKTGPVRHQTKDEHWVSEVVDGRIFQDYNITFS